MRDVITLFVTIVGSVVALVKPFVGLLVYNWLAFMRPQDLSWGPARSLRLSFIAAIAMLVGTLVARKEKTFIKCRESWLILALAAWVVLSAAASQWPSLAWPECVDLLKRLLVVAVTIALVRTRKRFEMLALLIALSLGFFGAKAGIFVLRTAGGQILRGPGGALEDNNDFALALAMTLPLLIYLGTRLRYKSLRYGMYAAAVLTVITILMTFSRGGFLALVTCGLALLVKSRRKVIALPLAVLALFLFFVFTPESVKERISSIRAYGEDSSAQGRIYAWKGAIAMAVDRPLFGVGPGMETFMTEYYSYRPDVDAGTRAVHNTYLQMLAGSGFPALLLYLVLVGGTFVSMGWVRAAARSRAHLSWARSYANMIEVSLITFAVGGAFLSRAHFELVYQIVGLAAGLRLIVARELAAEAATAPEARAAAEEAVVPGLAPALFFR